LSSPHFLGSYGYHGVIEGYPHNQDLGMATTPVQTKTGIRHDPRAVRDFQYFARLHEKHALPVYPIVIFSHASARPEPEVYEVDFPDLAVLRFCYRVIQLNRLSWRDFVNRPNPVASALMSKMKMTREERPRVKLECLRLLATLKLNRARMCLISGFVDTYLRLTWEETLKFNQEADSLLERKEKETIMELTTSWKEEGRLEGRYEANQQLVLRLLRHRWGSLDPAAAGARANVAHRAFGNKRWPKTCWISAVELTWRIG